MWFGSVAAATTALLAVWAAVAQHRRSRVPLVRLSGDRRSQRALLRAASRLGVFRIDGTPFLPLEDVAVGLRHANELFALDDATKLSWNVTRFPSASARKPGPIARGYIPFGGESGVQSQYFEVKEGFAYSAPCSDDRSGAPALELCNAWPTGHDEFHDACLAVLRGAHAAARAVVEQLALALRLGASERDELLRSVDEGAATSIMRLFHYRDVGYREAHAPGPAGTAAWRGAASRAAGLGGDAADAGAGAGADSGHVDSDDAEGGAGAGVRRIGSSPHTDWHVLTVIAEDAHGGFEFRDRASGRWRPARTRPGELLVVVGDLLQLASARRLHSPVHRVQLPAQPGVTRTSFTLFAYPRSSDTIGGWMELFEEATRVPRERAAQALAAAKALASIADFNTLLAPPGDTARLDEPIGDVLLRKWRGVAAEAAQAASAA